MCLALPAEVVAVNEQMDTATVALDGVRKEISTSLVENVTVGEFLLVHVGYALNKVSQEEAERTMALFAEAGLQGEPL